MSKAASQQDLQNLGTALKRDIDDVLTEVRNLADMTHHGFARMEKRFERRFDKHDKDIARIFTYLDAMAKRQEISDDERLVMGHQIERAFAWLKIFADKVGVELKP